MLLKDSPLPRVSAPSPLPIPGTFQGIIRPRRSSGWISFSGSCSKNGCGTWINIRRIHVLTSGLTGACARNPWLSWSFKISTPRRSSWPLLCIWHWSLAWTPTSSSTRDSKHSQHSSVLVLLARNSSTASRRMAYESPFSEMAWITFSWLMSPWIYLFQRPHEAWPDMLSSPGRPVTDLHGKDLGASSRSLSKHPRP